MTGAADPVRAFRELLDANGWRPVPMPTGDDDRIGPAGSDHVAGPDAAGTGLLCDGLRILRVDIDDPQKSAEIEALASELLGRGPTRIRENSPLRAIIYRAEAGAPPRRGIAGEFGTISILGAGDLLVAFGHHPSEFSWRNGSPADTRLLDLPAVAEDDVGEFLRQAGAIIGPNPRHKITALIEAAPRIDGLAGEGREGDAQPGPQPATRPPVVHWHGKTDAILRRREIVKGLFPAGEVALLAGQSGAGKTFIAIDLATALATGSDFFGHPVREPGGTLFLLGEGAGTISERLEAVRLGKFPEDESARELPIAWHALSGSLFSEEVQKQVFGLAARTARDMEERHDTPLRLVVVDTVAAAFAMADENDAAQATAAMKILQRLHGITGALVAGVAHYGKSAATGVRGSSAFTASADVILAVNADREEVTGKVLGRSVALTKSRWRDAGWQQAFELQGVRIGEDEDGEDCWSCFVKPAGRITDIAAAAARARLSEGLRFLITALDFAMDEHGEPRRPFGSEGPEVRAVEREDLRAVFYSRYPADGSTERQRTEAKRRAFNRALTNGQKAGGIGFLDEGARAWIWRL